MFTFDHDELFALSGWLTAVSAELDATRHATEAVLAMAGRQSSAAAALGAVVIECESRSWDLSRRALFLADVGSSLWDGAWRQRWALSTLWWDIQTFAGSDNDPQLDAMLQRAVASESALLAALEGLTPAQVAALMAGLPIEVGRRLASRTPAVVAATDGMPLVWRELATRRLMVTEADRLRSALALRPTRLDQPSDRHERAVMQRRLALLDDWIFSDRVFVWFDPANDGQLIEVVGDLASAKAIGVFVPGITSELDSFEMVASQARSLVATAEAMNEEVAVIAWLGYDAPAGIGFNLEAATTDKAVAGAPRLVDFVDGLAAQRPDIPLSVVAHSYGSVVAGWAAAYDHLHADRLIIIGSPNLVAADVEALNLPGSAGVFVGEAPHDPVVALGDLTDGWRDDWSGLGHGYDPGDCDWSATVFEVQDVGVIEAHTTYTSGQSAESIVRIMVGAEIDDRCD